MRKKKKKKTNNKKKGRARSIVLGSWERRIWKTRAMDMSCRFRKEIGVVKQKEKNKRKRSNCLKNNCIDFLYIGFFTLSSNKKSYKINLLNLTKIT